MKKIQWICLLLALMMVLCIACTSTPAATGTQNASPVASPSYKDTMLAFDQLVPDARIVILQNALNFSREGFYTDETKPVSEDIVYKGETVAAYPMHYVLAFLTNGSEGMVTVTNNDGTSQTITADDFAGLYAVIDFTSDTAPLLYNPETGTELADLLFAVTEEGEAIYSVVSSATYNAAEVIADVGWDTSVTYRYVATDQFYIPVSPSENATGEIRGTLSGAVNGSFPDLKIASGKINDVLYIEVTSE